MHEHPAPPYLERLPEPAPEIGQAARADLRTLIAAILASATGGEHADCLDAAIAELTIRDKEAGPAEYTVTPSPAGRTVHFPGEQRAAAPAEAVLADAVWCMATMIDRQARASGLNPGEEARQWISSLRGAEAVMTLVERVVEAEVSAEVALEMAQGVPVTFWLMGGDGHAELMRYVVLGVVAVDVICNAEMQIEGGRL